MRVRTKERLENFSIWLVFYSMHITPTPKADLA